MQISQLRDDQLLQQTKILTQTEREVLTKILHHLREIERRKLYCDLRYGSLFEYCVKELRYSEGQAGRRIQAMRLIKEIPQIEHSIASGELSLSNVAQAQSMFRHLEKAEGQKPMTKAEKIEALDSLKNKSTREGQKELLKRQPQIVNPKSFEKERLITPEAAEVRFLMNENLKEKLGMVRSLLGPKAIHMGYGELIEAMADLSTDKLSERKFGKKRAAEYKEAKEQKHTQKVAENCESNTPTPAPELAKSQVPKQSVNLRYIPRSTQHEVWIRDGGHCSNCKSRHNLNFDHVRPVALGGGSTADNLRLLCFECNQRQGMKIFGTNCMGRRKTEDVGTRQAASGSGG